MTGSAVVMSLADPPGDLNGDCLSGPSDVIPVAAAFGPAAGEDGFDESFHTSGISKTTLRF